MIPIRRRAKAGTAFVFAAALSLLAAAAFAQTVEGPYLTTDETLVRKGPGANYEVVATVPKGITIHVVGKEGYWLKVQSKHGNPPGYIDDRYARPLETRSAGPSFSSVAGTYVTKTDVNLREGPGLHFRVVATIPKDVKINVGGGEGDWLKVESKHGKAPGYLEKHLVEREPPR